MTDLTLSSTEPVAIIGAGAIGMFLAAALARAGHPLAVCGGRPFDHIEITDGETTESFPVHHIIRPEDVRPHHLVIVAVKAQNTPDVAGWLHATVTDESIVLVAQNGIEHRERVAPYVGGAAVVPAIVYVPVDRTALGRAVVHRPADRDLTVPDDPAAVAVAKELSAGEIRVENTPDFTTAAWRKALINMGSNPITTLTGRGTEVTRDPGIARYLLGLLTEVAVVARADGAHINGQAPAETIAWLQDLPDGSSTSMLQDRLAGRPLEHDALTGAVLRAAHRHQLEAPHVESLHAFLNAINQSPDGKGRV